MTIRAFVIGHPIDHSRSPLIHGTWLKQYGIDGSYAAIDVADAELPGFLARVRAGEFAGGNVTIPHKQAVFDQCDTTSDVAAKTGAVNTLMSRNGHLWGTNTDVEGFAANLDDGAPGWQAETAIVLGAGGAARAILVALADRGVRTIHLLNRTEERAIALAEEMGIHLAADIVAGTYARFAERAPQAQLLVNTSAVGMHGTRFENIDIGLLPKQALVTDIVYTPLETPLLADARAHGLQTVDGLGMLLHQAVPGFEAWFGVRPQITRELRDRVERDMGLK